MRAGEPRLRNPISALGIVIATIGAVAFLVFLVVDLLGLASHANPYLGIVFFIALPMLFVLGLLLIPLGIWRERRRALRGLPPSMQMWPRVDLNNPRARMILLAVLVLTPVNVAILMAAGVKGVEAMDSVAFCGQTCHVPMEPEFVAHADGPHARVHCVSCHVGPGARGFIQAKLAGARQLYEVAAGTYARPIPSPVPNMRPARETCQTCHWPTLFHGSKLETRHEFAEDEANTETVTTLRLKIGGVDAQGRASGIHWHAAEQNQVEYIALDEKREQIGWVKVTTADGSVREYTADGVTPEQLAGGARRQMDCLDCHNRPAHIFARSVERAVNEAMASGAVAKDLPFVRREAVKLLKTEYPDRASADSTIPAGLTDFYRTTYPALWTSRQTEITRTAQALKTLHQRNVFPAMKLNWGFHADQRGHMEFTGCFRCHDESHKAKDGSVIRQDCEMCHDIS